MKTKTTCLILGILMLILSGCAGGVQAQQPGLEGSTWVLTGMNGNPPLAGTQPTIAFAEGQVSGSTGCNHYGGSYQVDGDSIHFNELYSTEMACMQPDGVMDQERAYLDLLNSAQRYELAEGELRIFAGSDQTLIFAEQTATLVPTVPTDEEPDTVAATPIAEQPTSTPVPVVERPEGFKSYEDSMAGVLVFLPEDWRVTGVIEGQYAIVQSYPEDKYVGGEAREPGDTKCDLNIRPEGTSMDELIAQWESDPRTTIVSKEAVVLQSGLPGTRFEVDNMGRSTSMMTEINGRVVELVCFGDFTLFDQIAATLSAAD